VRRGEIYWISLLGRPGHVQTGRRPGVVVQADELRALSTLLVAPTSTRALPASFRPEVIVNGEPTRVLIEQLGAVDASRIGQLIGRLTVEEQWGVDAALIDVLALH